MVLFDQLVNAHIVTGATGLISLWGGVLTRKGSRLHKLSGRVFAYSMLVTGLIAVGISTCSLIAPRATHPFDMPVDLIRGLFGWMMLYLGILTFALTWHSLSVIWNRASHSANRHPFHFLVQGLMGASALNCAAFGVALNQGIMIGVAIPGIAAAILNSLFLAQRKPLPDEWLVQHFRNSIGAGISVYTAFFAFGAVNTIPALAFNPVLWTLPTALGVGYMIWHQWRVFKRRLAAGQRDAMLASRVLAQLNMLPAAHSRRAHAATRE